MQVTKPLVGSLLLLSTFSVSALAEQYRHIADPLNLSDSLYVGFDGDVLKVGGSLATSHQKFSGNTILAVINGIWVIFIQLISGTCERRLIMVKLIPLTVDRVITNIN